MANKKRGAFKGHCALCAIARKWRRGTRSWGLDERRYTGKNKRIKRGEIREDED